MKIKAAVVAVVLVLVATAAGAQMTPPGLRAGRQPGVAAGGGPGPGMMKMGRALEENFFPPELVMQHQRAIGLKEDQQGAIRAEMQRAMSRFTDLQWQQSAEAETMQALLAAQPVDEKAALAQFDKLITIETEVKRLHLATLIKVKNVLTPEQQTQLGELERQRRGRPDQPREMPGGPGGGPMMPGAPPPGMPMR